MIKRLATIFIALSAFAIFSIPAKAQMSDDAVYNYVKDGLAAGKSQETIAKELAVRGVSKSQAEQIKKRFENKHSATDIARSADASEARDHSYDQSMEANVIEERMTETESFYTESSSDLLSVFGRDIFSNRNLSFAPSENIATPENYKLGPGDEVIIDIWGTNQNTIRQTISPDGFINVEGIGIIYLTGMTVKEADAYMRRQLNRIYSVDGEGAQSEIKLTLGAIRTIQVNVMGEVATPGTYYLSSLSTVYHALYRAGGFTDLSSIRNIELIRNGKKKVTIDMYDFIIKGQSPDDVTLQEGDIILVPTYESLVSAFGKVKRPMIYEMKEGETVDDLLNYAGGFAGNAYKSNVNMERKNGREYQIYTILQDEYTTFKVMDGDVVTVGTMIDRYENRLEIKGAVYRPGVYQFSDKIHTVKQLITIADGLKGDAFVNRAIIQRELPDYTIETVSFDLKKLISGEIADIELKPNDILTISSIHELEDIGVITVYGEVANPGSFQFAKNTTIEDIIIQAGGLLESASTAKIDVSRRIKDANATEPTDTLSRLYTFSIKDGFIIEGNPEFILEPYDNVYVRRSPSYNIQDHVRVEGEVLFPGTYALAQKNSRISDLIKLCEGTSEWAYVKGAKLNRRMTPEERARMQSTLNMLDNTEDSVSISKLNLANSYDVGIDLEAALANPGGDADIVLRDGDALIVPEYINTVKISGNVLYPNVVSYNSSMTVKDYVEMAGGYGFKSKKSKAYIVYINGQVAKAKKINKNVVQPGCEIIIPEKQKNEGSLQRILSVATTSSSIATMLATIYNIIK